VAARRALLVGFVAGKDVCGGYAPRISADLMPDGPPQLPDRI
jgi:hypothetical protein